MKKHSHKCFTKALYIFALLFALSASTSAQSQWVPKRVGPAKLDLNTVYFLDSKRGWVGGDDGFLSRTDDGGTTWLRQVVGTTEGINDIYFRDKENGFLLAGNTIFASQDSGTRWSQSRRFMPNEFDGASVELYSVRFPTKKRGWVVGSISRGDNVVDSILVFTEDSGATWQRQKAPSRLELIHVDFVNEKRGWIVGAGGTILYTQDAGQTWTPQPSGTGSTIFHIDFRNEKRGWAVGEKGTILRTIDGGMTWTQSNTPVRVTLLSIQFINDDDGWAVGRSGTLLRSQDGGVSWIQQESPTKQNLYALYFNKKIGWAVGGDGIVLSHEQ
jgi:photosystem II stability/assembly factor-like uncharacterized protein